MKKIFLVLNFLCCCYSSLCQNLVPNPDFEIFGTVPCGWTNSSSDFAAATSSWISPTQATPDIFSTLISPSCSNYQPHSTDPSCNGWQAPHSGNIFAGFYTQVGGNTWREYLQVQLTQPMDSGHAYRVSMYISLSDNSQYATNNIGAGFSTTLTNSYTTYELGYAPQINHSSVISDTSNWVQLDDTIVATDAWQYLIIGNFFNDASTDLVFFNPAGVWDRSYYYVDDVSVEEISVAASPHFSATDTDICEKFCISFFDSSTNNPTAWEWIFPGGSPSSSTDQNPANICYTVPGIYDVTLITTNPNGIDTLTLHNYITVYATPPFPTITQVDYTLTSSPASSYQWQFNTADIPGATNQSYTILQTGYYTVVVSDSNGCINSFTVYVLISDIDDAIGDANISIYPNPSSGDFIVEWLNGLMVEPISIDVINALGQMVFSSSEKTYSSAFKKEIDLNDVTDGVYFIRIKTANAFIRKKIIIENSR